MAKKKMKYVLIDGKAGEDIQAEVDSLIDAHHPELQCAKIQLLWMLRNQPDPDGRMVLGRMQVCTEADRLMHGHDFKLMLSLEAWNELDAEQRRALLDHELSHGGLCFDDEGEPKEDENGQLLYRSRKHDLEEFRAVVERHGCYLDDLKLFVEAALRKEDSNLTLFAEPGDDMDVEIKLAGEKPVKMRQGDIRKAADALETN